MRDDEVGGRHDVIAVQRLVVASPVRYAIRIGYAVSSSWSPPVSGATLPLSSELRGISPVGELLALRTGTAWRRGRVATSPSAMKPVTRLVQVAGEHLAVGAEVDRLAADQVARAHGLPPRAGQRRDDRARERLVLARP